MLRACVHIFTLLFTSARVSQIAESRMQKGLRNAGLFETNSTCMAKRMVDRLTIPQLLKRGSLQSEKRSVADYLAIVRKLGDAEPIHVSLSAAALCTTGLAR